MTPVLRSPPVWSDEELEEARQEAIQIFRRERLEEPLEDYLKLFDRYRRATARLMDETANLLSLASDAAAVLQDEDLRFVARYLAGPPLSEDDLKALADVTSLSASQMRKNPDARVRIISTILTGLDPRRFPWVKHEKAPTPDERESAATATAALIAAQRVATKRRNEGKQIQEEKVRKALEAIGFVEVPRRSVTIMVDAPEPGQFCGESLLGTRKADFIVGLHDRRVMPIECKVSNSFTNSIKRLNNDAAAKAEAWRRDLGETQVVPTAVLSGLYKLTNLAEAQRRGLTLFWAHHLDALTNWLNGE